MIARRSKIPIKFHHLLKGRPQGLGSAILKAESTPFFCGMIDGIVPVDHPQAELRGLASFVEMSEIDRFSPFFSFS